LTPEAAGLLNIPEGGVNIEALLQNFPENDVNLEVTDLQNNSENDINTEEFVLNECERNMEETVIIEPQTELMHTEINNIENGSSNIKQQKRKYIINKKTKNETAQNINKGSNKGK